MSRGRSAAILGSLALGALVSAWGYSRLMLRRGEVYEASDLREPDRTIDVDSVGIHYLDQGQGEPIVLLHGMGASIFGFRHTIPALAERYRVLALDLPGFGYSDRPPDADYSLSGQMRVVREFMARRGVERAALLGHSMGGAIAQRLACTHPEAVSKLMLVNSAPANRVVVPSWVAMSPLRPLLGTLGMLALQMGPWREAVLRHAVWDDTLLTRDTLEGYFRPFQIRGTARALGKMLADRARDADIDIPSIAQPTLLLWGEGDPWIGLPLAEAMRRLLPDARLVVIHQAGHLPLEEQPDAANEALLAFLGEERRAPARRRRHTT